MNKRNWFVTTALALAGTLSVGMAQARDVDVQWSVTIGAPGYVQYQPVYTPPHRGYGVYAPQPVQVYTRPAPFYLQPAPARYYRHSGYQQPTRWDRDGDGVPNRRDGLYNPAWDRDGDGIPNRHDRYDNTRHDRDGDGIPNRHDRYDNTRHDRDGDGIPNRHDRYDNTRHDRDGDGIPNRDDRRDGREWRGR